jgi:hypothetical protein
MRSRWNLGSRPLCPYEVPNQGMGLNCANHEVDIFPRGFQELGQELEEGLSTVTMATAARPHNVSGLTVKMAGFRSTDAHLQRQQLHGLAPQT